MKSSSSWSVSTRNLLKIERAYRYTAESQGNAEGALCGWLQTTFEDFVLQGTSDSTDPGAYFLIQKYPQEELK